MGNLCGGIPVDKDVKIKFSEEETCLNQAQVKVGADLNTFLLVTY